ncbi:hypothetical protein BC829DRAFT_439366 [Chytridium lagenaria]|nr:hypothetical protein BC829DRAFT_439366 [Chytridium lagenaria]
MSEADKRLSALSLIDQASSDSTETVTPSDAVAMFNYGTALLHGIGVDADETMALLWLTRATNASKEAAQRSNAGIASLIASSPSLNIHPSFSNVLNFHQETLLEEKDPSPSQVPIIAPPTFDRYRYQAITAYYREQFRGLTLHNIFNPRSTRDLMPFSRCKADATHTVKEALEPVIPVRPLICDMFDDDDTCSESFDPPPKLDPSHRQYRVALNLGSINSTSFSSTETALLKSDPSHRQYRVALRQKPSPPSHPITGISGVNSTSSPSAETAFMKPNPTHRQYRVALNLGSINSTSSSSTETAFPNSDPSHRQYRVTLRQKPTSSSIPISGINSTPTPSAENSLKTGPASHRQYRVMLRPKPLP